MGRTRWMASVVGLLIAVVGEGAAQETDPRPRTTASGVYTAAQAARGRDTYAGACQGCHTPASQTGAAFSNMWGGRPLSELFAFISERMPKSEPGSLTPDEYAQVVAYLLKLNGMPAGAQELPADSVVLGKIRIDTASHSGTR